MEREFRKTDDADDGRAVARLGPAVIVRMRETGEP